MRKNSSGTFTEPGNVHDTTDEVSGAALRPPALVASTPGGGAAGSTAARSDLILLLRSGAPIGRTEE